MINDEMMIKKLQVFFDKQIPIHLTKLDNGWLNGTVIEISDEFIILDEFKLGKTPVFFKEIKYVETYTREVK